MANTEENNDTVYSQLMGTLRNISSTDKLPLIGRLKCKDIQCNDY